MIIILIILVMFGNKLTPQQAKLLSSCCEADHRQSIIISSYNHHHHIIIFTLFIQVFIIHLIFLIIKSSLFVFVLHRPARTFAIWMKKPKKSLGQFSGGKFSRYKLAPASVAASHVLPCAPLCSLLLPCGRLWQSLKLGRWDTLGSQDLPWERATSSSSSTSSSPSSSGEVRQ